MPYVLTRLPHQDPALLRIYLYFRAALAAMLVGLFLHYGGERVLGTFLPGLYFSTAMSYTAVCLFTLMLWPPPVLLRSFNRLIASLIIDVVAVLTLLHASGGTDSGLGYLLIVYVAIGSVFIQGQRGIAFAAMTSLLLVAESLYLPWSNKSLSSALFAAGSLGVLLFCTAFAFQLLTRRLSASAAEVASQARAAAHSQRLAQTVVARMRTGILVIDDNGRVELANESASQLLGITGGAAAAAGHLREVLPELYNTFADWRAHHGAGPPQILQVRGGAEIRVSLANLLLGAQSRTVLYLEDQRSLTQQAQQLKLASLGRLTASIAHEVRNPLGAVSHAAQLLSESPAIAASDKRLTEIIINNSRRVNQIVESVLAISRRREPQPELINLAVWLPKFLEQYKLGQTVTIELEAPHFSNLIKMDPTHLSQVLTNLLDNGLRYSRETTGTARVRLIAGRSSHDDTAFIEIIDYGPGIPSEQLSHIFEPFYTTSAQGSGLGLFIARELCEINQASLDFSRTVENLSCFRIQFSHHQRMY